MSAGLTGRADMLAHCWVRAMAPGWKSRTRLSASASCGAIFARAARTPSVSRARCARKPKLGASMVLGAGSGATPVIEENDSTNTAYRSTSPARGQSRPSPRRSITMPSTTPALFSNLRNILVKTGKLEWLRAYSHRKIMKRLRFYEANPYSSGARFSRPWRMSMPFTRRAGLLAAAGAVAANALALTAGPATVHSQQPPVRKAAFDQNEIERLISRATITTYAKRGHFFNVLVKSAQYSISFELQMEKGPVPHRVDLEIGIKRDDGTAIANLSQTSAGGAIQYPISHGWGKVLASRPDTPPVFTSLFGAGRELAGKMFGSTAVPQTEVEVQLDARAHSEIREFARQLLSAGWLANPNHPNHFRQVSGLKIGLK